MSNVSQNVQAVLDQVYRLYFNPDVSLKEKASKWLEEFQSSVSEMCCIMIRYTFCLISSLSVI